MADPRTPPTSEVRKGSGNMALNIIATQRSARRTPDVPADPVNAGNEAAMDIMTTLIVKAAKYPRKAKPMSPTTRAANRLSVNIRPTSNGWRTDW